MKHFIHTITTAISLALFCTNNVMGADSVYDYSADCCDYTPDAAAIQQKKMEMLL